MERRRLRYSFSKISKSCCVRSGYFRTHAGLSETSASLKLGGLGSGVVVNWSWWRVATSGGVCGALVPTITKKGSGLAELRRMKSLDLSAKTSVELPPRVVS